MTIRPADVEQAPLSISDLDLPAWAAAALEFVQSAAKAGETVTVTSEEETMTPAQMARQIGISRAGIQRRIASGEIRSRKVGNRHRIPAREVERFHEEFNRG